MSELHYALLEILISYTSILLLLCFLNKCKYRTLISHFKCIEARLTSTEIEPLFVILVIVVPIYAWCI